MNLFEYRQELSDAHRSYREAIESAANSLEKRLYVAHEDFLGENQVVERGENPDSRMLAKVRDRDYREG